MTTTGTSTIQPFNPLDTENISNIIVNAFISQPFLEFPPTEKFFGAGVYGLWTEHDDLEYYHDIDKPIYIGKAENGSRKGNVSKSTNRKLKLWNRLQEHNNSISMAINLDPKKFKCKVLVLEDFWIPTTETRLIEYYQPTWNIHCDGFGTRYTGIHRGFKGKWDILHPGREYHESVREPKDNKEQILKRMKQK